MIEVIVAGNLTKDAELRPAGNSQVCGFSVAADTGFGDKKQTMFFSCSLWGNQGAAVAQYLKKGNPVTVIGEMSEREYDGKQYKEIRVNSIKLQGSRNDNQQNNQGYQQPQQNQAPQQGFNNQMSQAPRTTMNNAVIDEDCPFQYQFHPAQGANTEWLCLIDNY